MVIEMVEYQLWVRHRLPRMPTAMIRICNVERMLSCVWDSIFPIFEVFADVFILLLDCSNLRLRWVSRRSPTFVQAKNREEGEFQQYDLVGDVQCDRFWCKESDFPFSFALWWWMWQIFNRWRVLFYYIYKNWQMECWSTTVCIQRIAEHANVIHVYMGCVKMML